MKVKKVESLEQIKQVPDGTGVLMITSRGVPCKFEKMKHGLEGDGIMWGWGVLKNGFDSIELYIETEE